MRSPDTSGLLLFQEEKRMLKSKKAELIKDIEEKFSGSSLLVFTEFKGLKMTDTSELRNILRKEGMQVKVVKNTLAVKASEKAGLKGTDKLFSGPTAVVLGKGDPSIQTKALVNYLKTSKIPVTIKGGFLDGKQLTLDELIAISQLPGKDALAARLLGQLQAPMYYLVAVLNASMRNLVLVLKARQQELEKSPA